jgi:hypothetical protein
VHVDQSQNAFTETFVTNANTGAAAGATFRVGLDAASDTTKFLGMTILGTSYTTSGLLAAQVGLIEHTSTNSANMVISEVASGNIVFATTSSRTARARITNGGLFGIGIDPLPTAKLHVDQNQNAVTETFITNGSTGGSAGASVIVGLNSASDSSTTVQMTMLGTNWSTVGVLSAQAGFISHRPSNGAPFIFSAAGTGDMIWTTTTSFTERMRLQNSGILNLYGGPGTNLNNTPAQHRLVFKMPIYSDFTPDRILFEQGYAWIPFNVDGVHSSSNFSGGAETTAVGYLPVYFKADLT